MAGDWIKFETTTPDKPEVVRMASVLGIDQDAVVGKLLRLWVWADQNSVDGNGVTVTSAFLDRLTFCPNFANAMREVGWLVGDDGAMALPNFGRHNGKTAKERAVSNRRVAKHRIGNGDVTVDVTPAPLQKPLPEKRREEKKDQEQRLESSAAPNDKPAEPIELTNVTPHPADRICQLVLEAYHVALPRCKRISVMNPKRQRRIHAAHKLARQVCKEQGWEMTAREFWEGYFGECDNDPWLRGDVPNPNNPRWKQNLDVLIAEDRFAEIMDRAIESMKQEDAA